MPYAAINDRKVRGFFIRFRDTLAQNSERNADYAMSVISSILNHAVDSGLIEHNHSKGISNVYHSDRSQVIWLSEHVEQFTSVASDELQLALTLALHV